MTLIYCRHCQYVLNHLDQNRCPECGNDFDPSDPETFLPRVQRSRLAIRVAGWLCDAVLASATMLWLATFLLACQINIDEAPMHGGGSSYTSWAPCNEEWVIAHPGIARQIQGLPRADYEWKMWLIDTNALVLPYPFNSQYWWQGLVWFTLFPLALAVIAAARFRAVRSWWRRGMLLVIASFLTFMSPHLYGCLYVLWD